MKNYTITVNGNVYNVTVEENAGGAPAVSAQPVYKAAPAAPKAAPAASGAEGSVKIEAPMSGKILGVKASVGQAVKKGDVLLILEAMKMENDIVATADGTVATINVSTGDMVEPGKVLATLR